MIRESPRFGNDRYRFGTKRITTADGKIVTGMEVYKDIDHFAGGTKGVSVFIPWEAFTRVKFEADGKVLIG